MTQLLYQRLEICRTTLVAASGSQIDTFNLESGSYLSSWKCVNPTKGESRADQDEKLDQKLIEEKSRSLEISEEAGPAAKRRKLLNGDGAESEAAVQKEETNSNNGQGKKKASRLPQGNDVPNVVLLASTDDSQHVVAVTGEDKTLRVFRQDEGGVLEQLSQRVMFKRPCALSITSDNTTIVCGDKFGDVYSLPLIPSPNVPDQKTAIKDISEESLSKGETSFVPAANEFTVHSKKNRKALENQKKHVKKSTENTDPDFEHKLLLGHVSMLTDLALVCVDGRNYILTADRDEHIRISRGIPQSHVIEGYCLGHTEFITRICAPTTANNSNLLISGGGGDELFAWDLPSGNLIQKVDLKSHVEKVTSEVETQESFESKITVSGIYHVRTANELEGHTFAVICEGVPAIFFFFWNHQSKKLSHTQTLRLDGNPLDLVSWNSSIIVSVDTYFTAGSTTQPRSNQDADILALQHFIITTGNIWEKSKDQYLDTKGVPKSSSAEQSVQKEALTNLLYNLQNLRKHEKEEEE